jgi:hypothetical protein
MMMDDIIFAINIFLLILAVLALGFLLGVSQTSHLYRQEAIEAGVAYYSIDEVTGERSFEYRKGDGDE